MGVILPEKFITSDKIFCHLDRLAEWQNGKDILPITVEVHASNRCDNSCYYCMARQQKDGRQMSKENLFKVVERLAESDVRGIIFSGGGEPLLNPNSAEAVALADKLGLDVGFITNGVNMDEKTARLLAAHCTWVRFSLDAGNRETYKKIRGADTFNKVIENIKMIVKAKELSGSSITIGAQCVVDENNVNDIVKCTELAKGLGLDYIQLRPLEYGVYEKGLFREIQKGLEQCKHFQGNGFTVIISGKWAMIDPFSDLNDRGYSCCWCYPFIGAIDVKGDVYICCHMVGEKQFCYGNILQKPLREMIKERERCAKRIDLGKCPQACRGNQINLRLEGLKRGKEHHNFL